MWAESFKNPCKWVASYQNRGCVPWCAMCQFWGSMKKYSCCIDTETFRSHFGRFSSGIWCDLPYTYTCFILLVSIMFRHHLPAVTSMWSLGNHLITSHTFLVTFADFCCILTALLTLGDPDGPFASAVCAAGHCDPNRRTSAGKHLFKPWMWLDEIRSSNMTWVFPKIVVPQNGWFMMENPLKWIIWGYHYFWKHPHGIPAKERFLYEIWKNVSFWENHMRSWMAFFLSQKSSRIPFVQKKNVNMKPTKSGNIIMQHNIGK